MSPALLRPRRATAWTRGAGLALALAAALPPAARAGCSVVFGQGRLVAADDVEAARQWDGVNLAFNGRVAGALAERGESVVPLVARVGADVGASVSAVLERARAEGCERIVETTLFADDAAQALVARLREYPLERDAAGGWRIGAPRFVVERQFDLGRAHARSRSARRAGRADGRRAGRAARRAGCGGSGGRPMSGAELDDAAQARLAAALARTLAADGPVETIETHISRLLVTPRRAWKLKKPVAPGFLDFTTRDARRRFCEAELRLNRRLAPRLYVDVVPVTGSVDAPCVGGDGEPIDWLLRMHAFAQDGLWDRLAARGALGAPQIDALVALLVRFQAEAEVAPADGAFGTPQQVRAPMLENLDVLESLFAGAPEAPTLARLRGWEAARFPALEPVFAARLAAGRVREGHGDLHLGNVVADRRPDDGLRLHRVQRGPALHRRRQRASPSWRWTCCAHGLPALAHRFVDGWTDDRRRPRRRCARAALLPRATARWCARKVAALRSRPAGRAAGAARRRAALRRAGRHDGARAAAAAAGHPRRLGQRARRR
ncbi:MAG: hypothetical protein MZW92_57045 [Comamonadaceae bacterium]|nr:hypothetical protein [Comamonadaceae bacterium]